MPTTSVFIESKKAKILAANRNTETAIKFAMNSLSLQEPYARMIVSFLQEHSYNIYTIPDKVEFNVGKEWIKYQTLSARYFSDYQFSGFEFQFGLEPDKKSPEISSAYLYKIQWGGYGDLEYQFISDRLLPISDIASFICQQLNAKLIDVIGTNSFQLRIDKKEFVVQCSHTSVAKYHPVC